MCKDFWFTASEIKVPRKKVSCYDIRSGLFHSFLTTRVIRKSPREPLPSTCVPRLAGFAFMTSQTTGEGRHCWSFACHQASACGIEFEDCPYLIIYLLPRLYYDRGMPCVDSSGFAPL